MYSLGVSLLLQEQQFSGIFSQNAYTSFGIQLLLDRMCTNCRITESQTAWGWKGPLEITWPNTLLKQSPLQHITEDCVQAAFE